MHNKSPWSLEVLNICYLTVSVGREFRKQLSQIILAQYLMRLQWRCYLKAWLWLEDPLPRRFTDMTDKLFTGGFHSSPCESESEVTQSCPTLCNPMDFSLPGSSVHGIFQARILEWVAISFSRRSSWPRDWAQVSSIVGRLFTIWASREALCHKIGYPNAPLNI